MRGLRALLPIEASVGYEGYVVALRDQGGGEMKRVIGLLLVLVFAAMAWAGGIAFLKYEKKCTGFKKICVYDYLGDDYAITIDCVQLCPLTIEVD